MRENYPIDEAVDDLGNFFKKYMTDQEELKKTLNFLEDCRRKHHLPMRHINVEFAKYLDRFPQDRLPMSIEEKQMMSDLFYFWE